MGLIVNEEKFPFWMRVLGTGFGIISIVLAAIVLMKPDVETLTLVIILSAGLLIEGFRRLSLGYIQEAPSRKIRSLRIGIGGIIVILSLIIMINPGISVQALIILLTLALFIQGIWRISHGWISNRLSGTLRAIYIGIGSITLVFSVLVLVYPAIAQMTLVLLLAFVLLINGVGSIFHGVLGIKKGL